MQKKWADGCCLVGDWRSGELQVTGGFSGSGCWSVELVDGRRVFVKVAGDDEAIAGNRNEATVLAGVIDRSGDRLVHGDLAPGIWCRDTTGVWRFVDWASAHRGNPVVDEVIASIRLTRLLGPPVSSNHVGNQPELVAFVARRSPANCSTSIGPSHLSKLALTALQISGRVSA